MNSLKKHIIIADDHAVVRTGLQMIFDETQDLEIVDEAASGDELLEKISKDRFDLVIMDMSMPGKDSLDTLAVIAEKWPTLPVVIFSMNSDEAYALRMIRNGAAAYINKQTKSDQVTHIIRTVLNGKKYVSPYQSELFAGQVINASGVSADLHLLLSDREYQVFILLAGGTRNSEIAERLGISKNTVNNHRNNIMKKMSLSQNSDLTRYALQHRIIL